MKIKNNEGTRCKIDGCDRPVECQGLCSAHRKRLYRGKAGSDLTKPIGCNVTPGNISFDKFLLGKILQPTALFQVNDEQKLVQWSFNATDYKTVEISHITDLQFGHKAFKQERFEQYRDWLLDKNNRFVLLGGDLIDAATVLSVQNPYENRFDPSEQCYKLVELLWPLRERILGYVGGNHERRCVKAFGDAGRLIATMLKVPYSSGEQVIQVHYGEHKPFRITLYHGRGASRTKGAKMNVIDQTLTSNPDSHLCLIGHLHDAMLEYRWRKIFSNEGTFRVVKQAAGMSTSFLDYWNTYAEIMGLGYTDTLMIRCVLEPDGHWEITMR